MDSIWFNETSDALITFIKDAPIWLSMLFLAFAACIEYIFPPIPGDVIVVAGGFLAARGAISLPLAAGALILGSVVGSSLGWLIGYFAIEHEPTRRFIMRFLKPKHLVWLHVAYQKHGKKILLANRFLPGIRAVFMIAAGIAEIPYRQVLLWGGLSAVLWNSILISVGFFFSLSFETMLSVFFTYIYIVYIAIGAVIVLLLAFWLIKRWSKGAQTNNKRKG